MHNIFVTLLHIYQSYGYTSSLYLKRLFTNPKQILQGATRQRIDRTPKSKVLFFLARIHYGVIFYLLSSSGSLLVLDILLAIGLLLLFPCYLISSNVIISPIQRLQTYILVYKAKKKLAKFPTLKIIGIAGSYGKTTQKEILSHLLSVKYKVLSTIGNQNTLIGVANCILTNLDETHDIFVVEMGEDHSGDIKQLCSLVQPQIGIITGVTKQHMDTFSSYEEVITTIGELFAGVGTTGTIYMQSNFPEFETYTASYSPQIVSTPSQITYLELFGGISFVYRQIPCTTKLLAKHSVYPILVAREIGRSLGIEDTTCIERISTLEHVPHRLAPIYNAQTKIRVIDDTYNGNIEGFKSGMDLLAHAHVPGKKWYITPGLLNVGEESGTIHYDLGRLLASAAEKVILIKNKNTLHLEQGLLSAGFKKEDIYTFSTATLAHGNLQHLLGSGDVILFQNDIPDLLL